MKKLLILMMLPLLSCTQHPEKAEKIRQPVDTVGFASKAWQMDSLMARIQRTYSAEIDSLDLTAGMTGATAWRVAISPHDDYTYVGPLYPALLSHVKARTVFMFGVAHKAAQLGLENVLVFDDFPLWRTPYGDKRVSGAREELISRLPKETYTVNDSMQALEHSLEALLPFLQYYDQDVEFVPILVPYMSYERMEEIAGPLSDALAGLVKEKGWTWGKDFAILISTDAVHYGDEDWGGKNYAPYGTDSVGYEQAVHHENVIIDSCLAGPLDPGKIRRFTEYTVSKEDYRQYKWTWCGRYSVPMGLLTARHLAEKLDAKPLDGVEVGYMTSIYHESIPVMDLGMGVTAPAKLRHWVGYAAVGYE